MDAANTAAEIEFERYRRGLLTTQARWAGGLAMVTTTLSVFLNPNVQRVQGALALRLGLGATFALIFASTFLTRRTSASGIWQTLATMVVGSVGAALVTMSGENWSVQQQFAVNIIVFACGFLFLWRPWEMATACAVIMLTFVVPPALSQPAPDFSTRAYLLGVTMAIAMVASHRSLSLRRTEFVTRRSLEERGQALAVTSERLRQSLAELENLNTLRDTFFANISHELRTPLTLIFSPLDALRRRAPGEFPPDVAWQLEVMHRNAGVLLRQIDALLDVIRQKDGAPKPSRRRLRLDTLVQDVTARFEPHAQQRGVTLTAAAPSPVTMVGDARRLDTLLSNLLSNALKFTPAGGTVHVALRRERDAAELSVSDSGRGLSAEEQLTVFDRFVQGQGSSEGVGLGLSLVKEVARLHGGDVSVTSAPGSGATFRVRLPSVPTQELFEPERSGAVPLSEEITQAGEPENAEGTVLIIEDEEELRHFLYLCLRDRFRVLGASSGSEGLSLARERLPDVIVCDLRLPDLDGMELTRTLRANGPTTEIPIILISAYETGNVRVQGLRQGAVDFLSKPFSQAELTARIDVQLRLRRLAAQSARAQKLTMLQTLLEGLAHEVRTPLNAVFNSVPLLRKELGKQDRRTTEMLLELIEESTGRISALIDELTALSRDEGNVKPVEWDPSSSIDSVLRLLEPRCRNIVVQKELAFRGRIRGRSVQLNQLLTNVLDNAVRAMPEGGALKIRTENQADQFVLRIQDTGGGIPSSQLSRIFDPFFTTRPDDEGVGLGLHISRQIAQAHGGELEAASELGRGAVFTLRLPLQSPTTEQP